MAAHIIRSGQRIFRRLGNLSHSPAVLMAEMPDRVIRLSVHFSCMAITFFVGYELPPADNVGFLQRANESLHLLRYYYYILVMVVQFIRFQRASSVGTRHNSTVRATTDRENPVPRSLFGTYGNQSATNAHTYIVSADRVVVEWFSCQLCLQVSNKDFQESCGPRWLFYASHRSTSLYQFSLLPSVTRNKQFIGRHMVSFGWCWHLMNQRPRRRTFGGSNPGKTHTVQHVGIIIIIVSTL